MSSASSSTFCSSPRERGSRDGLFASPPDDFLSGKETATPDNPPTAFPATSYSLDCGVDDALPDPQPQSGDGSPVDEVVVNAGAAAAAVGAVAAKPPIRADLERSLSQPLGDVPRPAALKQAAAADSPPMKSTATSGGSEGIGRGGGAGDRGSPRRQLHQELTYDRISPEPEHTEPRALFQSLDDSQIAVAQHASRQPPLKMPPLSVSSAGQSPSSDARGSYGDGGGDSPVEATAARSLRFLEVDVDTEIDPAARPPSAAPDPFGVLLDPHCADNRSLRSVASLRRSPAPSPLPRVRQSPPSPVQTSPKPRHQGQQPEVLQHQQGHASPTKEAVAVASMAARRQPPSTLFPSPSRDTSTCEARTERRRAATNRTAATAPSTAASSNNRTSASANRTNTAAKKDSSARVTTTPSTNAVADPLRSPRLYEALALCAPQPRGAPSVNQDGLAFLTIAAPTPLSLSSALGGTIAAEPPLRLVMLGDAEPNCVWGPASPLGERRIANGAHEEREQRGEDYVRAVDTSTEASRDDGKSTGRLAAALRAAALSRAARTLLRLTFEGNRSRDVSDIHMEGKRMSRSRRRRTVSPQTGRERRHRATPERSCLSASAVVPTSGSNHRMRAVQTSTVLPQQAQQLERQQKRWASPGAQLIRQASTNSSQQQQMQQRERLTSSTPRRTVSVGGSARAQNAMSTRAGMSPTRSSATEFTPAATSIMTGAGGARRGSGAIIPRGAVHPTTSHVNACTTSPTVTAAAPVTVGTRQRDREAPRGRNGTHSPSAPPPRRRERCAGCTTSLRVITGSRPTWRAGASTTTSSATPSGYGAGGGAVACYSSTRYGTPAVVLSTMSPAAAVPATSVTASDASTPGLTPICARQTASTDGHLPRPSVRRGSQRAARGDGMNDGDGGRNAGTGFEKDGNDLRCSRTHSCLEDASLSVLSLRSIRGRERKGSIANDNNSIHNTVNSSGSRRNDMAGLFESYASQSLTVRQHVDQLVQGEETWRQLLFVDEAQARASLGRRLAVSCMCV